MDHTPFQKSSPFLTLDLYLDFLGGNLHSLPQNPSLKKPTTPHTHFHLNLHNRYLKYSLFKLYYIYTLIKKVTELKWEWGCKCIYIYLFLCYRIKYRVESGYILYILQMGEIGKWGWVSEQFWKCAIIKKQVLNCDSKFKGLRV